MLLSCVDSHNNGRFHRFDVTTSCCSLTFVTPAITFSVVFKVNRSLSDRLEETPSHLCLVYVRLMKHYPIQCRIVASEVRKHSTIIVRCYYDLRHHIYFSLTHVEKCNKSGRTQRMHDRLRTCSVEGEYDPVGDVEGVRRVKNHIGDDQP